MEKELKLEGGVLSEKSESSYEQLLFPPELSYSKPLHSPLNSATISPLSERTLRPGGKMLVILLERRLAWQWRRSWSWKKVFLWKSWKFLPTIAITPELIAFYLRSNMTKTGCYFKLYNWTHAKTWWKNVSNLTWKTVSMAMEKELKLEGGVPSGKLKVPLNNWLFPPELSYSKPFNLCHAKSWWKLEKC